jgi:hypothetical protein
MTKCRDCLYSSGRNIVLYTDELEPELECEHEANWRPSRGNMKVDCDYRCGHFEPRENKGSD